MAHRSISELVSQLDEEQPGLGLAQDFAAANSLHTNFYEDWLDPMLVRKYSEAVRRFIKNLNLFL